jgi:hypothetical protein
MAAAMLVATLFFAGRRKLIANDAEDAVRRLFFRFSRRPQFVSRLSENGCKTGGQGWLVYV